MSSPDLPLPTVQPPNPTTDTATDPSPVDGKATVLPSPEPTGAIESGHGDVPFELEDTKGRVAGVVFSALISGLCLLIVVLATPDLARLLAGALGAAAAVTAVKALRSKRRTRS